MTRPENGESRTRRHASVTPTARLVERYARVTPNYGLYPSRERVATGFTSDNYRQQALQGNQLPLPASLALNIRIPSVSNERSNGAGALCEETLEHYLNGMYCELALKGLLFDADRVVDELHIGAGNAGPFRREHVESLMRHVQRHFTVQQDGHRELSVYAGGYCNEPDVLPALVELGFNRLQLGLIGSAETSSAMAAARSAETLAALVAKARDAGFRSVGADVCYGLVERSTAEFAAMLDAVLALQPDRIAIRDYWKLAVEEGAAASGEESRSPGASERLDMALTAWSALEAGGYHHLGNGHFVAPEDDLLIAKAKSTLHFTTRGYSSHGRCDVVGFGAAALSRVHNCQAENFASVDDYVAQLGKRRLPVCRGLELTQDDRMRAHIMQTVLCQDGLLYGDVERQFDADFSSYFSAETAALVALARDGLIELNDTGLTLTPAGDLLRSQVAMAFDLYCV